MNDIHMGTIGPEYDILQGDYWVGIGEIWQGDLEPWLRMYVAYEFEPDQYETDDDPHVLPPNWIAGLQ
jgi:hypothetical protein